MKNLLRIAVPVIGLFVLNVSRAQAQVDLGVKAGLSIPNLTSGNSNNPLSSGYNSRLGLDAGIHAEFHLTKKFSIQPELRYSSQGGKKNGNQAFVPDPTQFPAGTPLPPLLYADYKSVAKLNYLMLPVLAKYHFLNNPKWDLYAAVGPFVSLLLSAKNETSGSSIIYADEQHKQPLPLGAVSFDRKEDIKDKLNSTNFGIDGHVGIAYKLNQRSSIFLEGGGHYGFITIQKDEANGKNRTGAGVVTAGYAFRICK
ncbi:MAG TPA: porin family protein [Chitinophaga sp.]|uniref:porin family protein n=1 Tax=Chitinophaga sp. TaxID=1869181 RepID=UPI002BEED917|nr:porin family protein [Chitinophaga sp.]HVI44000.1 porin family protein [Chitinophaga sp.]